MVPFYHFGHLRNLHSLVLLSKSHTPYSKVPFTYRKSSNITTTASLPPPPPQSQHQKNFTITLVPGVLTCGINFNYDNPIRTKTSKGRQLLICLRIGSNVIESDEIESDEIKTRDNGNTLDKEIKFNREVKFVSSTGR